MEIVLTREAFDRVLAEAAGALPEEACGILLGRAGCVEQAIPARNVHPSPRTHFEIDPQVLIDAHRAGRAGGAQVLGYYHSHPAGPALPSATDRAQAAHDRSVWAILGEGGVAFWRDGEDGFAALSYVVEDG